MLFNPRKAMSEWVGHVFVGMFFPAWSTGNLTMTEDCWIMQSELTKLAFALAAYHADHGSYPTRLADLAPKYVVEVSKDIFNDSDLHYRQEGRGYLLYSVGPNGKDDGGKGRADAKEGENRDDLIVRMPAAK